MPAVAAPLTTYTCALTDEQAAALERALRSGGFEFFEAPHTRLAARKNRLTVALYRSGKLVVQGRDTREFVEFVLEPLVLKEARLGYEAVHDPGHRDPRIGVDESGKGDFFGPLCIAGVYVNDHVLEAFEEAGIRDSKRISSDRRVAELARLIRRTPGCLHTVVAIGNPAYNRLYAEMGSVNRILAWGHARVIENLLKQRARMQPPPVRVISDQFAANKATVASALMRLGRQIELVQRHKAEADPAVAAASILARDEFVRRLATLGKQFGLELPKGASARVDAVAREFVQRHGPDALEQVAKLHFRTAARAKGEPEPPRVPWRKRPAPPVE
ncbi:MAG: ribonuclease HIII [Verrucomicrobia bacterium]|nr:MAG: ribonuclease HIII [Verrucomicrobiota bacterium]